LFLAEAPSPIPKKRCASNTLAGSRNLAGIRDTLADARTRPHCHLTIIDLVRPIAIPPKKNPVLLAYSNPSSNSQKTPTRVGLLRRLGYSRFFAAYNRLCEENAQTTIISLRF